MGSLYLYLAVVSIRFLKLNKVKMPLKIALSTILALSSGQFGPVAMARHASTK